MFSLKFLCPPVYSGGEESRNRSAFLAVARSSSEANGVRIEGSTGPLLLSLSPFPALHDRIWTSITVIGTDALFFSTF